MAPNTILLRTPVIGMKRCSLCSAAMSSAVAPVSGHTLGWGSTTHLLVYDRGTYLALLPPACDNLREGCQFGVGNVECTYINRAPEPALALTQEQRPGSV